MSSNSKKHVTATKFADTLELRFVFNAVTKDGYKIKNSFETDFQLHRFKARNVDNTVLRKIEDLLEKEFAQHMQKMTDIITGKMTAEELKTFLDKNEIDVNLQDEIFMSIRKLSDGIEDDIENFKDKFEGLISRGHLEQAYKPRFKGPIPQ